MQERVLMHDIARHFRDTMYRYVCKQHFITFISHATYIKMQLYDFRCSLRMFHLDLEYPLTKHYLIRNSSASERHSSFKKIIIYRLLFTQ